MQDRVVGQVQRDQVGDRGRRAPPVTTSTSRPVPGACMGPAAAMWGRRFVVVGVLELDTVGVMSTWRGIKIRNTQSSGCDNRFDDKLLLLIRLLQVITCLKTPAIQFRTRVIRALMRCHERYPTYIRAHRVGQDHLVGGN